MPVSREKSRPSNPHTVNEDAGRAAGSNEVRGDLLSVRLELRASQDSCGAGGSPGPPPHNGLGSQDSGAGKDPPKRWCYRSFTPKKEAADCFSGGGGSQEERQNNCR